MNLFGKVVRIQSGRVNRDTQRVAAWQEGAVEYTSNFVANIHNRIADEISKVSFNHVKYEVVTNGVDTLTSREGSDIDEVLNWKPKGQINSANFWKIVIKKMLLNTEVILQPHYDRFGTLYDLTFLDEEAYNEDEVIRLVSPFLSYNDTSILDNALSSIATKLNQGKLRGLYKLNANMDYEDLQDFESKANREIRRLSSGSMWNGIAPIDPKGELIELKKDYSVLNAEEINLIKAELMSAYFINERILLGTASQEEQMQFNSAVINPILFQLEKELSYKLIKSSVRRKTPGNKYYERIVIDNQLFKFATLKDFVSLFHENTNAPIFTMNRLLMMIGEQPVEGGDVYFTNKNSQVITSLDELKTDQKGETTDETNPQ